MSETGERKFEWPDTNGYVLSIFKDVIEACWVADGSSTVWSNGGLRRETTVKHKCKESSEVIAVEYWLLLLLL